jgi:hypothetical protein
MMKNVIKLEEAGMFCLSLVLYNMLGYSWWLFLLLILTPDIAMLGYLISSKTGAVIYNIFHHKGIAILLYILGVFTFNYMLIIIGIILFAHSCIDRLFGFGLRYINSPKQTHLDRIREKLVS